MIRLAETEWTWTISYITPVMYILLDFIFDSEKRKKNIEFHFLTVNQRSGKQITARTRHVEKRTTFNTIFTH